MATDVDVQYFSHLNGLTLGNNWGDLIRLLDKALVTGIDFTQITAASIDEQGDVHITLYSDHNAMLFQVVELSGFTPTSVNQKYRIKGVPNSTQLILKSALDIAERSITVIGTGKLASLGYDIIFRDEGDVKRVYRAKNPTSGHPFIRIDESISDGVGNYASTYAKYAMVGLLEHMDHIDDYENPDVLQMPVDMSNLKKNWRILGTGQTVFRGWARWYWARGGNAFSSSYDRTTPNNGARNFTLCGDSDAFYYLCPYGPTSDTRKILYGAGNFKSTLDLESRDWFLMALLNDSNANYSFEPNSLPGGTPLTSGPNAAQFMCFTTQLTSKIHIWSTPIIPDWRMGHSNIYSGSIVAALEVPLVDTAKILRGSLRHVYYCGRQAQDNTQTDPIITGDSMYITDGISAGSDIGTIIFYLGELE